MHLSLGVSLKFEGQEGDRFCEKKFVMGAGGEELKVETKTFLDKKEKSAAKKSLLVTMEPRDR